MRRTLVIIALVALPLMLCAGIGFLGWHLYRLATRPTLESAGGTVLIYEADTSVLPENPAAFRTEDLVQIILERLDSRQVLNITVRPLDPNRIEIDIPRREAHDAAVQECKELLAQMGRLEFRILANERDDKDGIEAARMALSDPDATEEAQTKRKQELQRRADQGLPPPPPVSAEGNGFEVNLDNATLLCGYSWIEVGRAERMTLGLNDAARTDPTRSIFWEKAQEARMQGKPIIIDSGRVMLFGRSCTNRDLTAEERASKKNDYFLLGRDPEAGKAVTGEYLTKASATLDYQLNKPAVNFTFNQKGGDLFYELTSQNKPDRGRSVRRQLAIILDGQIMSAPNLNEPIRADGQITGQFTMKEAERMANMLRSGALPVGLKLVSETTVEPKK